MKEELKLHELSVEKASNKELLWLVALRDTNDYRWSSGVVEKNGIKERYPQAVIKEGEIVWCYSTTKMGDKYKERLEVGNSRIHPFNNHFLKNYLSEDFRELTQQEKEDYLKQ